MNLLALKMDEERIEKLYRLKANEVLAYKKKFVQD
jgi:hypothetical protein